MGAYSNTISVAHLYKGRHSTRAAQYQEANTNQLGQHCPQGNHITPMEDSVRLRWPSLDLGLQKLSRISKTYQDTRTNRLNLGKKAVQVIQWQIQVNVIMEWRLPSSTSSCLFQNIRIVQ